MDVVCRSVDATAQSGMALRSFRRAAPPCEPQRFSASTLQRIARVPRAVAVSLGGWTCGQLRRCGQKLSARVCNAGRHKNHHLRIAGVREQRGGGVRSPSCTGVGKGG
jgi:hypothetical protein